MTKNEFTFELGQRLSSLPKQDIIKSIDYYSELIDDSIEGGMTELEAVASLGSVEEIASSILDGFSEQKENAKIKIEETPKAKQKRRLRAWEIVLIVLGSPIWLSLLIAVFAVLISLVAAIFAVMISLFAVDFSLAGAGLGILVAAPFLFVDGAVAAGLAFIGCALILLGCAPLLFLPLKMLTKLIFILLKKILLLIKRCFVGKEAVK